MQKLIIDCNASCHKARHTLGELNYETMRVGVIFGFFVQLLKLAKDHNTNQFVFCWDSQRSHRQKLYPAYKERRRTKDKTPEEKEEDSFAYAQFDKLYDEILPAIGFKNNFKIDGYEGDDLIASIIDTNLDYDFVIVSGDEDMYQCLTTGVTIQKQKGIYTEDSFRKEYGIDPAQWATVKAIAGCDSDEVQGIKGIGEKTAIKYLLGQLPPNYKGWQSINSPEGKAVIARNRPLVTLPFKGCPDIIVEDDKRLSLNAFMDMCNDLNFQYFLRKDVLAQWKTHLNLQ